MKKLSVCIILFITVLLFTACRIESNISDSANISESQESSSDLESVSETDSTHANEQIEKDETVSYETNDISSYDTNDISNIKLQNVEMTIDDGQLIDTTPIYFTEVLGTRKRYPNSLPNIIGFQYPYIFYERMTVVVEDADKNDAALYIGRYSIETKEAQEFAIENFTAVSDEARLVVDEDRIVYMYCTLDEQGELKINIELYDYKNNTSKLLSTNYVYNVFGYAKKLNEKELVFFFYESVSSNTQQVILHYDLESEKLNEIYRGNNIVGYNDNSTSTKDIWAIDTNNGNIELLMQQLVDGKMVFYLCTLNNQGAVIQETKLDALAKYDSIEDTADSLVVKGNYLFIHYSQYNKSEKNSNAPFSILYI